MPAMTPALLVSGFGSIGTAINLIMTTLCLRCAFELGQRSEMWHGIQNASFFVTGLLFWWPVVQPWPAHARLPQPMIPLYLFTATLPCDALSAFLVFCDRAVYRGHPADLHLSNISALADQQTAGAFMWVSVTFLYLVPALVMTVRALSPARPG